WTNEMTITNDEEMKYELNLLVKAPCSAPLPTHSGR
ncbi:MAG: hypothetical protein QOG40_145, partial [Solirubrobacteraceae bacterium]|nr:hypothetical protein [Solirubrobacteraceae bacterium]